MNKEEILKKIKNFPIQWVVECPIDFEKNSRWKVVIDFIKSFNDYVNDDRDKIKECTARMNYGVYREMWDVEGINKLVIYPITTGIGFTNEDGLTFMTLNEAYNLIKKQTL